MVKTLRITSIVAALLAIAVFALPIKYGVKTDENIRKFLNSPGVLEKFKAISGNRIQKTTGQVHPLVQQSQAFASILNPPVIIPPPVSGDSTRITRPEVKAVVNTSPQFTVKIISYCQANPELSLALINEPGKGTSWVRQTSTVNHLLIDQIKDGFVIVRNGQETFELKIDEKKFSPAPPVGTKPLAKGNVPPSKSTPVRPPITVKPPAPPVSVKTPVTTPPKTDPETEPDPERAKKVEDLFAKIKLLGANNDSNDPKSGMEERAAQMQKLLTEFKNSNININEDEAKKLTDLGEMLESVKDLPSEEN